MTANSNIVNGATICRSVPFQMARYVGLMRVGGKRKLVIPAHLGFGDHGTGGVIPGGTARIFEVELLDVKPG